jgi:hypothetical protein
MNKQTAEVYTLLIPKQAVPWLADFSKNKI